MGWVQRSGKATIRSKATLHRLVHAALAHT
jgi:hypothetical protein